MEDLLGRICHSLPLEEAQLAVDTLLKIIQNVVDNPNVERFRQLRVANKTFYQRVWRHSAAQEFLALVGWTLVDEEKIVLQSDELLQEALENLIKAKDFLQLVDIGPGIDFDFKELLLPDDDVSEELIESLRKFKNQLLEVLELYQNYLVQRKILFNDLQTI